MVRIKLFQLACLVFTVTAAVAGQGDRESERRQELAAARQLFYDATRKEKLVDDAETAYEAIKTTWPDVSGRAEAYLGALQAVRGKHAFLPHNKFIWAMRGLKRMDAAIQDAPDDLEALFIHAAVCHHLPFFFGRGDDAKQDFRRMIQLIPSIHADYDWQLVVDVFKLIEQSKLSEEEKAEARVMSADLGYVEEDASE